MNTKRFLFKIDELRYKGTPVDSQKIKKAWENNFFTGQYELTEDGKKIIQLYLKNETYEQIGKIIGISKQRIGQIFKRLEKIINQNIEKGGNQNVKTS